MKKHLQLLAILVFLQSFSAMALSKSKEINPPTVSINYVTPMCMSADNPLYGVFISGTGNYLGGTFSSQEGLAMSPSDGTILPSLSNPGNYTVTYTIPANGDDPMVVATASVTIMPVYLPQFVFPQQLCVGEPTPVLPTLSANGIPGTWSPSVVSNESPGTYTYTFTPDFFCVEPYVLNINIVECSGIKLMAFLDDNSNGIRDSGEVNFPLGKFTYQQNNNGPVTEIFAPTGTYTINDSNTSNSYDFSFSIVPPYDTFYQATTTSIADVSPAMPHPIYDFPVTALQSFEDLKVSLVPVNAPRPGFTYENTIIYSNYGNSVVTSGSIVFTKDAHVSIASVSGTGITNTANGFTFDFANLQPFESRQILVTMQVPTLPTVDIGQQLANSVSITDADGNTSDTASVTQTIIGAYDPNDKTESHGPEIVLDDFTSSDALVYTIRFENTGTANAEKIRIVDMLDAKLNPETMSFVASSHPCAFEKFGNQLTFIMNNAQLPPSVPETNIGKGYVSFRIKPDPGYAIGDIIPNAASIYFDFNPAIVTNEWTTEFVAPLATKTFAGSSFVLYPNPASEVLKIHGNTSGSLSVVIYDMLGKTVLTQTLLNDTLNIQKLEPGIYMVSIASGDSKSIQKLIVK